MYEILPRLKNDLDPKATSLQGNNVTHFLYTYSLKGCWYKVLPILYSGTLFSISFHLYGKSHSSVGPYCSYNLSKKTLQLNQHFKSCWSKLPMFTGVISGNIQNDILEIAPTPRKLYIVPTNIESLVLNYMYLKRNIQHEKCVPI